MEPEYKADIDESLVNIKEFDKYLLVEVCVQRFTIDNAQQIFTFIRSRIKPDLGMVISLDSIEVMDSSGCGCLLKLHRHAEQAGARIAVATDSEVVKKLLRVLRFDRLAPICSSKEDALDELGVGAV